MFRVNDNLLHRLRPAPMQILTQCWIVIWLLIKLVIYHFPNIPGEPIGEIGGVVLQMLRERHGAGSAASSPSLKPRLAKLPQSKAWERGRKKGRKRTD
jgi:hypothetical protein